MKTKLKNKVSYIKLANLNKEFNISNYIPLSLVHINMTKEDSFIKFNSFGEISYETNLNDCNLIGNYNTIWSIFDKLSSVDKMKNHFISGCKDYITKEEMWFTKCANIVGAMACSFSSPENGLSINSDNMYYNNYLKGYYSVGYSLTFNDIYNYRPFGIKRGSVTGTLSDKISDCVYGSYNELVNWKNFILTNKLSLFINIVLTIDQHNNSYNYLPWITDKIYTDDELYKKFDLSNEEINLIEKTIIRYNRNSKWFRKYIGGENA